MEKMHLQNERKAFALKQLAQEERLTALITRLDRLEKSCTAEALLDHAASMDSDVLPSKTLNKIAAAVASNARVQNLIVDRLAHKQSFVEKMGDFISSTDEVFEDIKSSVTHSPAEFLKTALAPHTENEEVRGVLVDLLRSCIETEVGKEFDFYYKKDLPHKLEEVLRKMITENGSAAVSTALVTILSEHWPVILQMLPDAIRTTHQPYQTAPAPAQPVQMPAIAASNVSHSTAITMHPSPADPHSPPSQQSSDSFTLVSPADKAVQMMREKTGLDYRRIPGSNQLQIVNAADSLPTAVNLPTWREIMDALPSYQFGSGQFANRPHVQHRAPDGIVMSRQGQGYSAILPPDHSSIRNGRNTRDSPVIIRPAGPTAAVVLTVSPPIPPGLIALKPLSRLPRPHRFNILPRPLQTIAIPR